MIRLVKKLFVFSFVCFQAAVYAADAFPTTYSIVENVDAEVSRVAGRKLLQAGFRVRIVDANNRELWDSSSLKRRVYFAKLSPDGNFVALSFGTGSMSVFQVAPFRLLTELPSTDSKTGLLIPDWDWIGNRVLVGAGILAEAKLGDAGRSIEETDRMEMMSNEIFVFSLEIQKMRRLVPKSRELPANFTLLEVRPGGFIRVFTSEGAHSQGRTIWLKCSP